MSMLSGLEISIHARHQILAVGDSSVPRPNGGFTMNTNGIASAVEPLRPFIYLNCGSRGDDFVPFVELLPMAQSIGFEPDEVECVRLSRSAGPKYRFFQFAVGESSEDRPIYLTRNPACSSLLKPNLDLMSHFLRGTEDLEVVETGIVRTVSLDGFLPTVDVSRVDFLDLDTQ